MQEICEKSKKYGKLGRSIIRHFEEFRFIKSFGIKIGWAVSDKEKKKGDHLVFAECHKVTALMRAFVPYDFVIVIYEPNADLLSENQIKILIYHELLHIGIDDQSAEATLKIVEHDVEDFRTIIDRFGLDWSAADAVVPDILER